MPWFTLQCWGYYKLLQHCLVESSLKLSLWGKIGRKILPLRFSQECWEAFVLLLNGSSFHVMYAGTWCEILEENSFEKKNFENSLNNWHIPAGNYIFKVEYRNIRNNANWIKYVTDSIWILSPDSVLQEGTL